MRTLATLALALLCGAPTRAAEDVGLSELVRLANDASPVIDSARQNVRIRDAEASNAAARFFPSLDLTATHGVKKGSIRPPWSSQFSLALTETLYDGGESSIQLTTARLQEELANLELKRTQNAQALEIARDYYNYSLSLIVLELQKKQKETLDRLLRSISNLYQQGVKTRQDYLRFEIQTERAAVEVALAEVEVTQTLNALKNQVGTTQESLRVRALEQDQAAELARQLKIDAIDPEQTLEYRSTQIQNQITDQNTDLASARYWPQFFVTSELAYGESNYLGPKRGVEPKRDPYSWNALIGLKFNFLDWGTRSRNILIAETSALVQKNNSLKELYAARERASNLSANLPVLKASLDLNLKVQKLEQDSFKNLEKDYREGKLPYLDLISGLNNLLDSRLRVTRAAFELLNQHAETLYLRGALYDTLVSN